MNPWTHWNRQENKFTAELDRTLERYRDLEKTVADVDAGELTDTRMELRTGKEQSAASQLQKIYGVKYDYDMMRQSKLEVKKMLGEVTRKPSITQMLQRKRTRITDAKTSQKKAKRLRAMITKSTITTPILEW